MAQRSPSDDKPLAGRTIALPESRELDLLASMIEQRGGQPGACPLVTIRDAPDPAPILAWIDLICRDPFEDMIFLTGEGLYRLVKLADSHGRLEHFIAALETTRRITRGPKPVRALRTIGLKPDIQAAAPTTAGVIESLAKLDLAGHDVGVQLYNDDPNLMLTDYLTSRGARVHTVVPYRYASRADADAVMNLVDALEAGRIDAIAFTKRTAQVRRLMDVAREAGRHDTLLAALGSTLVAAVGPVVAQALAEHNIEVDEMPEQFHLKPMVTRITEALQSRK